MAYDRRSVSFFWGQVTMHSDAAEYKIRGNGEGAYGFATAWKKWNQAEGECSRAWFHCLFRKSIVVFPSLFRTDPERTGPTKMSCSPTKPGERARHAGLGAEIPWDVQRGRDLTFFGLFQLFFVTQDHCLKFVQNSSCLRFNLFWWMRVIIRGRE